MSRNYHFSPRFNTTTPLPIISDSLSTLKLIANTSSNHLLVSCILTLLNTLSGSSTHTTLIWAPSHIGIFRNDNVDHEAKLATIHITINAELRPTSSNLFLFICHFISKSWHTFWQDEKPNNKLSLLKSHPLAWSSSNLPSRRHEIVLTRLRIVHSRLTHTHLISQLHPLNCPHSSLVNIPLSIEHTFTC